MTKIITYDRERALEEISSSIKREGFWSRPYDIFLKHYDLSIEDISQYDENLLFVIYRKNLTNDNNYRNLSIYITRYELFFEIENYLSVKYLNNDSDLGLKGKNFRIIRSGAISRRKDFFFIPHQKLLN